MEISTYMYVVDLWSFSFACLRSLGYLSFFFFESGSLFSCPYKVHCKERYCEEYGMLAVAVSTLSFPKGFDH